MRGGDGALPELIGRPLGLLLAINIPTAKGTGAAAVVAAASGAAVAAAAVRHASACLCVVDLSCLFGSAKVEGRGALSTTRAGRGRGGGWGDDDVTRTQRATTRPGNPKASGAGALLVINGRGR